MLPSPTSYIHRSPRCRRCCRTCTLCTATGTSSPPASCCRWTADMWGDLRGTDEKRRGKWWRQMEWIARGWTKQMQSCFSYVTGERRLFTRRPWIGADSRRRRTDTSKHIYIIHQKPICIICFSNVSPVLIKMNKLLTVFPSVRRFLNSPFSLCCGKKIILLKWFNKMFCLWDK